MESIFNHNPRGTEAVVLRIKYSEHIRAEMIDPIKIINFMTASFLENGLAFIVAGGHFAVGIF